MSFLQQRKSPSDNYPSISFEIGFNLRSSASTAIERLDGALADGRILQVTYREASKFTAPSNVAQPSIPRAQTPPAAVAPHRELMPAVPSAPRAQQQQQQQSQARNGRELLSAKPQQQKAAPAPAASLQSRMMTAAELKTLQKQQARAAPANRLMPGVPKGPKGTVATPATTAAVPLAKRITLPLAMRLSAEAKMNGCVPLVKPINTSADLFLILTDHQVVSLVQVKSGSKRLEAKAEVPMGWRLIEDCSTATYLVYYKRQLTCCTATL